MRNVHLACVVLWHLIVIYIYMLHNKYIYTYINLLCHSLRQLAEKTCGYKIWSIANVWSCPIVWDQEEGSSTGEFIFNWHQLEQHEVHKLVPQSFGHHRLTLGFLGLWGFTLRTWYKKSSQLSKQLWINFRFVPAIWQWSNDHSRKSPFLIGKASNSMAHYQRRCNPKITGSGTLRKHVENPQLSVFFIIFRGKPIGLPLMFTYFPICSHDVPMIFPWFSHIYISFPMVFHRVSLLRTSCDPPYWGHVGPIVVQETAHMEHLPGAA